MFNFKRENIHHAYLIEGGRSLIPNLLEYLKTLDFKISGNPDLIIKEFTTFTIDNVRDIKSLSFEKPISGDKKIVILSAEYFTLESQNALLKVLEEPIPDVHFFVVTPQAHILLKTLKSRLILLDHDAKLEDENLKKEAQQFLKSEKEDRLVLVGKIIKRFEKVENTTDVKVETLKFLEIIEKEYSKNEKRENENMELVWKVKDYINDNGASVKNLLETLALTWK